MFFEVKCSWCGKFLGIREIPEQKVSLDKQVELFRVSHGICLRCKQKVLETIKINHTESKED